MWRKLSKQQTNWHKVAISPLLANFYLTIFFCLLGMSSFSSLSSWSFTSFCIICWFIFSFPSTMALILTFSQYLARFKIPCLGYSTSRKCHCFGFPIFRLFPVISLLYLNSLFYYLDDRKDFWEINWGNINTLLCIPQESCFGLCIMTFQCSHVRKRWITEVTEIASGRFFGSLCNDFWD